MREQLYGYFNRLYSRFLRIRGTPKDISLGLALGIFIGFSPTFGIQIVIAVFFASVLKWSKLAAVLGVQITNPLTAPFIYTLTYSLGAWIIGSEKTLKLSSLKSLGALIDMIYNAPLIFSALTLGGVMVGLPLSITVYLTVFWFTNRYQEQLKTGMRNRTDGIRRKMKQRKLKKKKRKT